MGEAEYEAAVIGPCVDELRAVLSAGFNYIENPHRFDQEAFLKLTDALCACRKDAVEAEEVRQGVDQLYRTYLPGLVPKAEDREANYGAIRAKVGGTADVELPDAALLFAASNPRRTPQHFTYPESFDAAQELAAIADLAESVKNRYVPGRRGREGVRTEEQVAAEMHESAEAILKRIRESQAKEAATRKRLETGKATTRPVPTTQTFPFPKYRASVTEDRGWVYPCNDEVRDLIQIILVAHEFDEVEGMLRDLPEGPEYRDAATQSALAALNESQRWLDEQAAATARLNACVQGVRK